MKRHSLLNLFRANAKRGSFKAEANTIYLYDMIAGDEFEAEFMGGISPKGFLDALAGMSGTVHLRINSPGGDVFAASAISQAMREYKGEIVAHVDGVAASAASVIAVNASKVVMAPGSLMMIHKAWTMALGDSNDLMETAALLVKVDGMLAETYATKSGGKAETFAELMAAETWFTPQEAKDAGLADEIAEEKPKAMAAWDLSAFAAAPKIEAEPEPAAPTAEPPVDELAIRVRQHAARMALKAA